MVCLATTSFSWCTMFVAILSALVKQVATSESEPCSPEQCVIYEFCCDGVCCSYFKRQWYLWTFAVLVVSVVVLMCFCFPPSKSEHGSGEPVQYYLPATGTQDLLYVKSYEQQPHYPISQSIKSTAPPWYQPYRYERLEQQSNTEMTTYPPPSAPPKSP